MHFFLMIFGVILTASAHAQFNTGAGIPMEFQINGTTQMTLGTNGVLSTTSAVKIGTTATCDGTTEGSLRYNSTSKKMEVCDATSWGEIASANGASTDTTPNAFVFTDLTAQSLGALVLSNVLTINGFNGVLVASISGAGTPALQVNGGAWVSAASISSGDTLRLSLVSSTSVSTAYIPAVTVGTVTDNWSVTTRAGALKAFETANNYVGNFGGLTSADSICQSEAATLGYAGTYKAILSDATTNAKDRLTLSYPIVRASDASVIDSASIWNGSLNGSSIGANFTWTGTNSDGTKHANTCSSWTTTSGTGRRGDGWLKTSPSWISSTDYGCSNSSRIYCIQQ